MRVISSRMDSDTSTCGLITRSRNLSAERGVALAAVRFQITPLRSLPPNRTRTMTPGRAVCDHRSSTR